MSTYHEPVMLRESIDALGIENGKTYIDATLGGSGYTEEILKRGGRVLSIDTDIDAINHAKEKLAPYFTEPIPTVIVVQANFQDIEEIAKKNGFEGASGIVFDLGVSSHHLDTPSRGFSYRFENAPLDMRMDIRSSVSASEVIAHSTEDQLYELFTKYGEEERSRAIAHAIISARKVKPIETTQDLYRVIETVVKSTVILPGVASRIFQAIRIYVNDELEVLKRGLAGAWNVLSPGGTLAVVTFHSLEDRIVKQFMREHARSMRIPKPIAAGDEEQYKNRRSRSAKLRVLQK
jgi:16S rRNA (cytosine1402-N4)-methyltransferase